MELNNEQKKAVDTLNGPVILISCPGSGKTTTLLSRINNLIVHGVRPEKILMITFTKAAAQEMEEKYRNSYGDPQGILFSTIHALCLRILLTYGGLTQDSILLEGDARQFLFGVIKKKRMSNDIDKTVTQFLTQYSALRNNHVSLLDAELEGLSKSNFHYLVKAYEEMKKEMNKIDFDDMLLNTLQLMRDNVWVKNTLQEKWDYIQVDEYQDVNEIQMEIVYMLAERHGNLCVAGDDDQSIYRFRGGRPEIMLRFPSDFPHAKVIQNSTNYRSFPGIINLANNLISHNSDRFQKDFLAGKSGDAETCITACLNSEKQIETLCEKILSGPIETAAVLYRNNMQAEPVADIFLKKGIPFYTFEKIPDSYSSWIWGDIEAYYRLAHGIAKRSDFLRVIDRPVRFLGKICRNIEGIPTKEELIIECRKELHDWRLDNAEKEVTRFFYQLSILKNLSPEKFLIFLLNNVGYKLYLEKYIEETQQDQENILFPLRLFETDSKKFKTMDEWKDYIVMRKKALLKQNKQKKGIVLSTMHRSKGLEWNHVYLIDCNEGVIPSKKSLSGKKAEDMKKALEEERRLFYVAITRAKTRLDVFYTKKNGDKEAKKSRFITDMDSCERDVSSGKNAYATHSKYGKCKILCEMDQKYMAVTVPGNQRFLAPCSEFNIHL